jgi:hypothetical protein
MTVGRVLISTEEKSAMDTQNSKADPDITVTDELDSADFAVITDGLRAYDLSQTGYDDFRPLAVRGSSTSSSIFFGGRDSNGCDALSRSAFLFRHRQHAAADPCAAQILGQKKL